MSDFENASHRAEVRMAILNLTDLKRVIPGVDGAINTLNAALAAMNAEWDNIHQKNQYIANASRHWERDRAELASERKRLHAEVADVLASREKHEEQVEELQDQIRKLKNLNEQLWRAVLKLRKAQQPPRPANETRGSGRSPRTGPSAQRPIRASGKTSPSRSATGKPSRSSGSGASPKTPRKATARPKRTARKIPRTG